MTAHGLAPETKSSAVRTGPSGSQEVLRLEGLTSGYGDLAAVRDVSLVVNAGEMVALFGPNGAGKSTTLLASVGELPHMGGKVYYNGQTTSKPLHKLAREGIAFVPEQQSVISDLTTKQNLELGRGGVAPAVEAFPELVPLLNRTGGLLSGGEKQMVALARAFASKPSLILIDELSLGLAPLIVDRLLTALRDATTSRGLAVLLVEQQARRALEYTDRWYLLRSGTVVSEGQSRDGSEALEEAYLHSGDAST
ncbi:ABC transporter ATP-binding protein [Gordonia sp. NPDC058843]|uniref:ABC transporter ATP-binding protein n=1 Tax=Gordonia sp. NPDC058843 TaxID=3346648 RepID=UPI0036782F65